MPATLPRVYINGAEVREDHVFHHSMLASVEVVQELNRHYWCTLEIRQPRDSRPTVEKWIGKPLVIASTRQDADAGPMFSGFVLDVKLEYELTGSFRAFITAVTHSYKLDLAPRREYHGIVEGKNVKKKKLDEIAQTMADRVGLKADLADAQGVTPNLHSVQWGETDWHFLWRLCDDFGLYLHPTPAGFKITKGFKPNPVDLQWGNEGNMTSFTVGARLSQPSVEGCHYDYKDSFSETYTEQEIDSVPFTGAIAPLRAAMQAESKKLPSGYAAWRNRAATVKDYQELLKAESRFIVGSKFECHGVSQVEHVEAGRPVNLEGRLDGKGVYNVYSVAHHWDSVGYSNSFWCTPWTDYKSVERPSRPFVAGLHSARVVDIDDPERRGEVRVQYYWQERTETTWVRHLSPHAGQDRGIFFRPELGDEVVIGFEEGDPERPLIVGSAWNKVDETPSEDFWGADTKENEVKRIVTKSGHRISIVDKPGKEAIVIATPRNLTVSMIERAKETGRPVIALTAADGDLLFSAPNGRIHLNSKYFSREVGIEATPPPKTNALPSVSRKRKASPIAQLVLDGRVRLGSMPPGPERDRLGGALVRLERNEEAKRAMRISIEAYSNPPSDFGNCRVVKPGDLTRDGLCPGAPWNDTESGFKAVLYKCDIPGSAPEYTVGFTGTQDTTDGTTDALQVLGMRERQYQQAAALGKCLSSKLNGNLRFTGHSLGGGLAQVAAAAAATSSNAGDQKFQVTTFNRADVHEDTLNHLGIDKSTFLSRLDSTDYHVPGELVQKWETLGPNVAQIASRLLAVGGYLPASVGLDWAAGRTKGLMRDAGERVILPQDAAADEYVKGLTDPSGLSSHGKAVAQQKLEYLSMQQRSKDIQTVKAAISR